MYSSPAGNLFQTRHHPERRGLAASRRTDEDDELLVVDGQVGAVDGLDAAFIHLGDVLNSTVAIGNLPGGLSYGAIIAEAG